VLLLEKTAQCEMLRTMLWRSDQCHKMTICGLSKCISDQQHVIAQNNSEMAEMP
jgi:hypothetical protein